MLFRSEADVTTTAVAPEIPIEPTQVDAIVATTEPETIPEENQPTPADEVIEPNLLVKPPDELPSCAVTSDVVTAAMVKPLDLRSCPKVKMRTIPKRKRPVHRTPDTGKPRKRTRTGLRSMRTPVPKDLKSHPPLRCLDLMSAAQMAAALPKPPDKAAVPAGSLSMFTLLCLSTRPPLSFNTNTLALGFFTVH